MKHLQEASKDLIGHLLFALNHSMDLKRDGVDPMVPFAVVIKGKEQVLKAFVGDRPDYADKMFEKVIHEEHPDYVVYAYDGYLTVEGIKNDAVLLKAFDRNDSEIYLVGQRFKPKSEGEEFEQIGNPAFLGTTENMYTNQSADRLLNQALRSTPSGDKKPWWRIW